MKPVLARPGNVPGRKTDVQDAEWIADLLAHGLLRASYVPDRPRREVRELVRYRRSLVGERTAEVNRLHKVLEGANIKLGSVASDVTGKSGRAILGALLAGERDPQVLAELAKGQLRKKRLELARALQGRFGPHQHFMLVQLLTHIDYLDEAIAQVEAEIGDRLRPFEKDLARLQTAPGVKQRTAEALWAALPDLSYFPSADHLASWAGLCPGNNESAGKRRSGRTRQGSHLLRDTLIEAAWAARNKKGSYPSAQFHRLASRRGTKRAAVAVAHGLLTSIYHMQTRQTDYHDLGAAYFDMRRKAQVKNHLLRRLEAIGYIATLQPTPSAA
jgi:transposase